MDVAALIVAIAGVLLALGSLWVSYITYRRDTPILAIRHNLSFSKPGVLGLDVTNVGKRLTTLTEVGYRVEVDLEVDVQKDGPDGPYIERMHAVKNIILSNQLIPLAPGEMKHFGLVLTEWPGDMVHADYPLRGYAVGSHGKTCWGYSRPFLREMLNSKWQPPKDAPKHLLLPYKGELKSMPVYASWKLWKPKYLRK